METKCFTPKTMPELFEALKQMTPRSKIIGGGTDLIIRMNTGMCEPDALLYMGGIKKLAAIESVGNAVEVGAMATMTQIADSKLLSGPLGALADAALDVGCKQIRNSGTIGGNVGNASAAGDLIPALFLLNAVVLIAAPTGEIRRQPIDEVVIGPGKTSLAYNEAIIGFILTLPENPARRSAFVKLGFRKTLTISRIGLGISLDRDADGVVTWANVTAGAISLTPLRVTAAEEYLVGKKLDADADYAVGKALSDLIMKVTPEMFDRDYKVGAAYGVAADTLHKFQS